MKQLSQTKQFARDVKRMRKRGKDLEKLQTIVSKSKRKRLVQRLTSRESTIRSA